MAQPLSLQGEDVTVKHRSTWDPDDSAQELKPRSQTFVVTTPRNWGFITSGAMFEALVTTLVFHRDSKAALLGRPGPDGGQDALSGDTTLVHQAKFHEKATGASAIKDAKDEAKKIARYRKPGHSREPQWRQATDWRLWTNAQFTATEDLRWKNEIVPIFAKLNLRAEYYERQKIEAELDSLPAVSQSYFGGEPRAFITIPEARQTIVDWEPSLARGLNVELRGREPEVQALIDFSKSDKRFALVHGTGGVGKTRLVLEVGDQLAYDHGWQVLWANVKTMETALSSWLLGIVPERDTILIVDEPRTENLLQVLAEQLRGVGRAGGWKVIVTARTPKDPVVRYLQGREVRQRTLELPVERLPDAASTAAADDMLAGSKISFPDESKRIELAGELTELFAGIPVWIALAVDLLERTGRLHDFPREVGIFADEYIKEITEDSADADPEVIRCVFRWIALYGQISVENNQTLEVLARESQTGVQSLKQLLQELVRRRALTKRGARERLREITPDVLRDHVLLRWLTVDLGKARESSDEAIDLVRRILEKVNASSLTHDVRAMLSGLVRAELILKFSFGTTAVLDGLLHGINEAVHDLSASAREVLCHLLVEVAVARPRETVEIVGRLRSEAVDSEVVAGPFGETTKTQLDVLLELAAVVSRAGMVVEDGDDRRAVIDELVSLVEAEAAARPSLRRGLPNDGLRAAQLLHELIQGGPRYRTEYSDAVEAAGAHVLDDLRTADPPEARLEAVRALLQSALSFERTQEFERGDSLVIQRYALFPEDPAWPVRQKLLASLKDLLREGTARPAVLELAWDLLASSHSSVSRTRERRHATGEEAEENTFTLHDDPLTPGEEELRENLLWASRTLEAREFDFRELVAARELWDWHRRYERQRALRNPALALEEIYSTQDLAGEFEPLAVDDRDAQDLAAKAKAAELACDASGEAIDRFLERADAFFGDSWRRQALRLVALELGKLARENPGVQSFVRRVLKQATDANLAEFARLVTLHWVTRTRETSPELVVELVKELEAFAPDGLSKTKLLAQIYSWAPRPTDMPPPVGDESDYLRGKLALFERAQQVPQLVRALAERLEYDWPALKRVLEQALEQSAAQLAESVGVLVDSVYWALRRGAPAPDGLGAWLLNQIVKVPGLDALGSRIDWPLTEIFKEVARPDVVWFANVVTMRFEGEHGSAGVRALGRGERISTYVKPVSAEDLERPEVTGAIAKLVALSVDDVTVAYHLPEYLRDVDPEGRIVRSVVVDTLSRTTDIEQRRRLARIVGAYPVNSEPWREMARPILVQAARLSERDRNGLFFALANRSTRLWRRSAGAVSETHVRAVERARTQVDGEEDEAFLDLWRWRLEVAEARLADQEEIAREERGE